MKREVLDNHCRMLQSLHEAKELQSLTQKRAEKEKDNARLFPALQDCLEDIEKSVEKLENQIAISQPSVLSFIDSIDNLKVKQIARLRYLQGLPWCEVSFYINTSESSCKSACFKYFNMHGVK